MSEAIQIKIDDQGDMIIPAEIRERLGLTQGMTFVAEGEEQGQLCLRAQQALPQVIEEDGILIVTSPLSPNAESRELVSHSLTDVVRQHRQRRLASLWQNTEQVTSCLTPRYRSRLSFAYILCMSVLYRGSSV